MPDASCARCSAAIGNDLAPYVYVGDALNDAPMFGGFPKSVGVANIEQ